MLISISGSQGVGKSTTISHLPYKQIERKTSRSILAEWQVTLSEVNNNRPLTVRFQDEILKRKINDEAHAVQSDEQYVTERTFADLFVYALVAVGKDNEYSAWLDEYYERCVEAQSAYEHVFYITGGHFAPVEDGVRAINQHYSRMVDWTMHPYTRMMTPIHNFTMINTPDLQERIELITTTTNRSLNERTR